MRITSCRGILFGCAVFAAAATAVWFSFRKSVAPPTDIAALVAGASAIPQEVPAIQENVVAPTVSEPIESVVQNTHISTEAQPRIAQSLDDILEEATRSGMIPVEAAATFRQASNDSLRDGRELARATRSVARSADGTALTYYFIANPETTAVLHSQIAATLAAYFIGDRVDALLALLTEAGEGDPSLDMLKHHRQITIHAADEEGRWQVSDSTYTSEGNLLAANTVFLGFDEDGELVWPEEYRVLLSE